MRIFIELNLLQNNVDTHSCTFNNFDVKDFRFYKCVFFFLHSPQSSSYDSTQQTTYILQDIHIHTQKKTITLSEVSDE